VGGVASAAEATQAAEVTGPRNWLGMSLRRRAQGENVGASADEQIEPGPWSARDEAERSRRFQALALPHLDAAYNLARWLSRNPGDAEDIVQEAFLRAFKFFDTFRGELARPWLLSIVRRVWYDEWRRRASSEEVTPFDETRDEAPPEGWETAIEDPETLAIRAENARQVHEALQRLPVEYREVMVLRELEELSYREIAVIADVPVGTVMSRLARGRRRLAALLGAHHGHEDGDARAGKEGKRADDGDSSEPRKPPARVGGGRYRDDPAAEGGAHARTGGRTGIDTKEAPDEL
jgi:RNA polymerase sigma factor (sigma-70 family)